MTEITTTILLTLLGFLAGIVIAIIALGTFALIAEGIRARRIRRFYRDLQRTDQAYWQIIEREYRQ